MNAMTRLEESEILTARIRALRAIYPEEHEALKNWGLWSADRRGIFPTMAPPSMWEQFQASKVEWPEDGLANAVVNVAVGPAEKGDRPELEDYDVKQAVMLDERIHGIGGLAAEIRNLLRVAYVTKDVPEYQFPMRCNCSWDGFCERLESALRFVRRHV